MMYTHRHSLHLLLLSEAPKEHLTRSSSSNTIWIVKHNLDHLDPLFPVTCCVRAVIIPARQKMCSTTNRVVQPSTDLNLMVDGADLIYIHIYIISAPKYLDHEMGI